MQTEKEKKFDRQIRLWGHHGQATLENARIAVLNAGPTCAETLKNLVLPNVGEFTVIDANKVSAKDCGNNFFVTEASINESRAKVVCDLLTEMNGDVKGNAVERDPVDLIKNDINFFAQFSLVICTQVPEEACRRLAAFLWSKNIPLLIIRSYGMIGYLRVVSPEHQIVEAHPASKQWDLYLHPSLYFHWPELKAFVDSFNMAKLDAYEHAHVPYLVILAQHMCKWLSTHDNRPPKTSAEVREFKDNIKAAAHQTDPSEENFDEAVTHARLAYQPPAFDDFTADVFNDECARHLTKDSANFWFLVAGMNEFMKHEGHGWVPVTTDLPDMTSETKHYVQLKKIFAKKAAADLAAFAQHVKQLTDAHGKSGIAPAEIEYFSKNVRTVRLVRTSPYENEFVPAQFPTAQFNEDISDAPAPVMDVPHPQPLYWYLCLRVAERFYAKHSRYPGAEASSVDPDVVECTSLFVSLCEEFKLNVSPVPQLLHELVRYGATEIHTISAFMGGVGAQEATKLILHQFVPQNDTFIYCGVFGDSAGFHF